MSTKTLILVRHAHRNTDEPSRDNGLSDKGHDQVKKLIKFARNRLEGREPLILTSPKRRCQETIGPVAKDLGLEMIVDQRLSEQGPNESAAALNSRIVQFIEFWKQDCPEVTIIASHGDWLPVAIQKLTGTHVGLKKSGWCEIESFGADAYLTWIVQKHY